MEFMIRDNRQYKATQIYNGKKINTRFFFRLSKSFSEDIRLEFLTLYWLKILLEI